MPHLKLEYSTNIKETIDVKKLFPPCHEALVDTIKADISNCQSSVTSRDMFYIGLGGSKEAFIQLEILIKEGRSAAVIQEAGQRILKLLEKYFARSLKELNVQLSVHIAELSSANYFKIESKSS